MADKTIADVWFRPARQPANRLAWHLQAPALKTCSATERIGLLKAGKMAAVKVNTSPKTAKM